MRYPFQTTALRDTFDAFPNDARDGLLALRDLIFDTAASLPIGRIEESLTWRQPSYAAPDTKAATPIRLGVTKSGDLAIFTHCQSSVIADFRALAPPEMRFDGNRALHLAPDKSLPLDDITPLIRAALTYRL